MCAKSSNFVVAYVKARYDSRLCRSMETRLTLRSPHHKQPTASVCVGDPINANANAKKQSKYSTIWKSCYCHSET